jgi:hypothetical protein
MISSAPIGSGVSPIEYAELILTPLNQEGVVQRLFRNTHVCDNVKAPAYAPRTQEMRRT